MRSGFNRGRLPFAVRRHRRISPVCSDRFVSFGVWLRSAKIQQATDSGGKGAKDVTAKSLTQLTQAGTDDNKQVVINFCGDDLDVANGFRLARLRVTVATAASLAGAVILGHEPRYAPASDNDLASADEIVW